MKAGVAVVLLSILIANCDQARTVPPTYFLLPLLRGGGVRPATPTNLQAIHFLTAQTLVITWTGSLDPDTGQPNVVYRIYAYEVPPKEYYRIQDLQGTTPLTTITARQEPFIGTQYFVVTAFDGAAESLPSQTCRLETVL
ncbi:MAG: fibronectin type III domain-containing protein [Leptospirales bacterium]|nr:fibronectin type III domain-containing protein [Leptospirales bacterium]